MKKKSSKVRRFDTRFESDADSRQIALKSIRINDLEKVFPQNDNQEDFIDMYDSGVPLICVTGYAGTAKSFLSVYCALKDVLQEGSGYDRIIIIRSAVETRSQGFLPGTQDEKDEPFEEPYKQIVSQLIPRYKTGYDHLKAKGILEFKTTGNLRGQTFDNAVIIVDEIQNMDFNEISTVIERVGENSRMILAGDSLQVDIDRKKGSETGFFKMIKVLESMEGRYTGFIKYSVDDIVRSGIVMEWMKARIRTQTV